MPSPENRVPPAQGTTAVTTRPDQPRADRADRANQPRVDRANQIQADRAHAECGEQRCPPANKLLGRSLFAYLICTSCVFASFAFAGIAGIARIRITFTSCACTGCAFASFIFAGFVLAVWVGLLYPLPAAAEEIEIESPAFTFDAETNIYRYEGARVRFKKLLIEADEVIIDLDRGVLQAQGRVRFQDGPVIGAAKRLELHTGSDLITAFEVQLLDTDSGYHLRAEKLVREEEGRYVGTQCELTSCDPEDPAWTIEAAHLTYRVNSFTSALSTSVWLGGVPVLWTPAFSWPTVEKRQSGFLAPAFSERKSSLERFETGSQIRIPYFLALDIDQDLTLTPENNSARGPALGAEYNYAFWPNQRGRLSLWGIRERRPRNLAEENPVPDVNLDQANRTPTRYWGRWDHNQGIGESTRLVGSTTGASDGQVQREYEDIANYRPYHEYQFSASLQVPRGFSALTVEHASEFTQESLFANNKDFTDGNIRPRLVPRASWYYGWQLAPQVPLGLELDTSLTRFLTTKGASGRAERVQPTLTYPLRLWGSLEFRPTLSRRLVRFTQLNIDRAVIAQGVDNRPKWLKDARSLRPEESFGQTALRLELRLPFARVYPLQDGRFASGRFTAVKHRILPRLIYRELEGVDQPLEGLLFRQEPALKILTFRLDNTLFGRNDLLPTGRNTVPQAYQAPDPLSPDPQNPTAQDPALPGLQQPGLQQSELQQPGLDPSDLSPPTRPHPRPRRPRVTAFASLNLIQRYNLLLVDKDYQPAGPPLPSPGETKPGEPLLPAIVEANYQGPGFGINALLRYHHQLARIVEYRLGLSGNASPRGRLSLNYVENEATYRTPENKLHSAGSSLGVASTLIANDQWSVGLGGTVGLSNQGFPLGRRLTSASAAVNYRPRCYGLQLAYVENIGVTTEFNPASEQNENVYFINRQILFTFDLGGLWATQQGFDLPTGQ